MIIFIALIIGLIVNYKTGGFDFNQNLCMVAGLFLIMPALLKFKFKDLLYFKNHKKIFLINLFFNFVIIPFIFLGIGYLFFGPNPIVFAFFLLGMIPGGGLLISWVMKTNGNVKLAFSLFLVNLFIFSLLFIPFAKVLDMVGKRVISEKVKQEEIVKKQIEKSRKALNFGFNQNKDSFLLGKKITENIEKEHKLKGCLISELSKDLACPVFGDVGPSKSAFIALFVLIIFPFIISRFILISNKLTKFLIPKIKIISQIATFFIIAYIFSIKEVHNIFTSNTDLLLKLFLAVIIIYIIIYALTFFTHKKIGNNSDTNTFFWNSATRFLTLGLIFSFFYIKTFGTEFLLVFVIGYFVQIIGSNIMYLQMNKGKK